MHRAIQSILVLNDTCVGASFDGKAIGSTAQLLAKLAPTVVSTFASRYGILEMVRS